MRFSDGGIEEGGSGVNVGSSGSRERGMADAADGVGKVEGWTPMD
jgi:hypothetical protein